MAGLNWGEGFAEAGKSIANTAGIAALQEQKNNLDTQRMVLANQLAGGPEDLAIKRLQLKQATAAQAAFDEYMGNDKTVTPVASDGTPPSASSITPASSGGLINSPTSSDGRSPSPTASGAGPVDPTTASTSHPNLPTVVPMKDGKGGQTMIGLPPGMSLIQARLMGPAGVAAAWAKWSGPSELRPGGSINFFNAATGKEEQLFYQPKLPDGAMQDSSGNVVMLPGATKAISSAAAASSGGSSQGELPAKESLEAFKKGLDTATELVPSYDPNTQKTTMITKADALKQTKGGTPVIAPPTGAPTTGNAISPGQQKDGSFKTDDGVTIPPPPKGAPSGGGIQTEPSAAQKATQSTYAATIEGWQKSVLPAAQTEQRFMAQAEALKSFESGTWASDKANIGAHLIAAGVDQDTVKELLNTDPAKAQIIMKNNFGTSLSTLAGSSLGRITEREIFAMQKNLSNPDLQPEANRAIIAQGVGIARFQQSLANGWNQAQKMGYADPLTYQEQFLKANPIQSFIDRADKELPTLKGEQKPGAAPKLSDINDGQTITQGGNLFKMTNGKPVYVGPVNQNND